LLRNACIETGVFSWRVSRHHVGDIFPGSEMPRIASSFRSGVDLTVDTTSKVKNSLVASIKELYDGDEDE
jgi:hypothetical protein